MGSGILGDLGDLGEGLKDTVKDAAFLGGGAAAGIFGVDFLMSKVLVSNGTPLVPVKWSPLAGAALGVVAGMFLRKKVNEDFGLGVVAGTVGLALSSYAGQLISPTMAAATAQASAAEASGAGTAATSGFGFGRALAGIGLRGGGFGAVRQVPQRELLFGVGTPDMSAAGMFGGANVAIEESGQIHGASVAFEESSPLAGLN